MDSESRAFEAVQFESLQSHDSFSSVPLRCRTAMIPQDITPWTLPLLLGALLRAIPRLPQQAPALIRVSRNSRD